jgi:hypothetical protein
MPKQVKDFIIYDEATDFSAEKFYDEFHPEREATGLDGPYYDLPEGATQLQDLIEYKDMNFSVGNIFKATYRLNDKATRQYNLEKIIFYAQRELDRELQS